MGSIEKTIRDMIETREESIQGYEPFIDRNIEKYSNTPVLMHQANKFFIEKIQMWRGEIELLTEVLEASGVVDN